ncbi:phytoene desaturase family protein [Mangrovibacillus cuniculi]|uniref:Phytoene desaturase n=1 Tax=Mangrovibacillus cuniculi TaxID=2593652 RepID=A0A7S8C9V2_9BACI|nr:phytoene desaturase family protein [Mangrovibacillus cuniculi]QPC46038.1 phytoene desaturase [Mangrovibacillus cuniculi]
MMQQVSVVGGGIGGLVSALLLQKQGLQVSVYEASERLGGRLRFVERDGDKIDQGPTIVLLPDTIKEILKDIGIEDEVELLEIDPLYSIHYQDGTTYTKYRDPAKQEEELKKLFPQDVKGFKRFMKDMKFRFDLGKPRYLETSFVRKRDFFTPTSIQTLSKLKAYQQVYQQLKTYFNEPKLREAYALQTLYIGGNPYRTPAIYSLVSYSEHEHGIYYIKGGYASLVEKLEVKMRELGISIFTNTPVHSVKPPNAIVLEDGEKVESDFIIINGDFPVAQKLVEGTADRNFEPSSGCFLVYMGIKGVKEDLSVHQFYLSKDFEQNMKEVFQWKQVPTDPSIYLFNPSKVDSSLAAKGKSVLYTLVPVPSGNQIDWEKEKEDFKDLILNRLEQNGLDDIRERIEWMEIRTPQEAMKDGLFEGGSFGIAPSLFQSAAFRPQVQPFPQHPSILAVGASVHPGGGIPIVMMGAKLVSEVIETQLEKPSTKRKV